MTASKARRPSRSRSRQLQRAWALGSSAVRALEQRSALDRPSQCSRLAFAVQSTGVQRRSWYSAGAGHWAAPLALSLARQALIQSAKRLRCRHRSGCRPGTAGGLEQPPCGACAWAQAFEAEAEGAWAAARAELERVVAALLHGAPAGLGRASAGSGGVFSGAAQASGAAAGATQAPRAAGAYGFDFGGLAAEALEAAAVAASAAASPDGGNGAAERLYSALAALPGAGPKLAAAAARPVLELTDAVARELPECVPAAREAAGAEQQGGAASPLSQAAGPRAQTTAATGRRGRVARGAAAAAGDAPPGEKQK